MSFTHHACESVADQVPPPSSNEYIRGQGTWPHASLPVSAHRRPSKGSDPNPWAVQFVLFAISTGNSIVFSSYLLRAATGDAEDGSWLNRGIAIGVITGMLGLSNSKHLAHPNNSQLTPPRPNSGLPNSRVRSPLGNLAEQRVRRLQARPAQPARLHGVRGARRPDGGAEPAQLLEFPRPRLGPARRGKVGRGSRRICARSAPGAVLVQRVGECQLRACAYA